MSKKPYIILWLRGGGRYAVPYDEIAENVLYELMNIKDEKKITITFEYIELTDEEYNNLPEFTGH